jgi:hypothetical protein
MRASCRAREDEEIEERLKPVDEGPSTVRNRGAGESFLVEDPDK